MGCLIELKLCEVSLKFVFKPILKISSLYLEKKKVLFLKKKFKPLSISKRKALLTDPIFSEGFGFCVQNLCKMRHAHAQIKAIHAHHNGAK